MTAERIEVISVDGDTWRIIGTGAYSAGAVYCHLASTTRFTQQRNGQVPLQMGAFVSADSVEAALDRPRGFYSWNRSLRGAFERGEREANAGASIEACPYKDARKSNGQLTWSRAFRTAWRDGFKHAQSRIPQHNHGVDPTDDDQDDADRATYSGACP